MVVLCATAAIVVAPRQAGKVRLLRDRGSARIGIVPQHPPAPLDKLLALAQGYAEFAMRNIGHVPSALLAESPSGFIHFVPDRLKDERAKDNVDKLKGLSIVELRRTYGLNLHWRPSVLYQFLKPFLRNGLFIKKYP